jgi:hypothetical protein
MKKKLSLSNTEKQEYNANAKRLMAAGVIPNEDKPSSEPQMLTVEQTGGLSESFVHAPSVGGYAIVVWVRIVALESRINISDCQVTPQRWDDTGIHLVDLTEGFSNYKAIGEHEYPRTAVLNHWISSDRSLSHRQVLYGAVIAQSFRPLPAWCDNGISIGVELCFVDQCDNFYPLKVDLRVMRDPKRIGRPRGYAGLYGRQAASESMHGIYGEKADLCGRASISPKEPNVPRANLLVHNADASPDKNSKVVS